MVTAEERDLGSTVFKEASREELAETTSDGEHFKRRVRGGIYCYPKGRSTEFKEELVLT